MAKIYGALEVAQLEWFTDAGKPAPASYIYRVIYVSDLKQVQVSDGTNWIAFLNTSTNQTIAGDITFTGAQIFSGQHRLSVTTNSSTGAIVALAATTPVIEFTGAVTSIAGIASGASGATVMLVNRSGNSFQVLDEGAGASASNRIRTGAGNITLANNASVLLTYVGDNRWHVVGGSGSGAGAGGAKNYYTVSSANSNFAQNTVSPWSAATLTLSGGVPTGAPTLTATQMAIATTATNPLLNSESLYNMQLTKSAANAQGQGFISGVLTIDREDVAKVLTGSFTYEVVSGTIDLSGTSTQSLEIWVYNVTANQWIQPAGFRGMNQSSGTGQVTFTFQTDGTPANVQYRVAVITAQTSTSAYVVNFNDFKIGPQTAPIGAVMTDFVSYTAATSGFNIGTTGTATTRWRRVGDSIHVIGRYVAGGTGIAVSGDLRVFLPTGLSFDTSKISLTSTVGAFELHNAGAYRYGGATIAVDTAQVAFSLRQNAATLGNFVGTGTPEVGWLNAGNDEVSFEFMAPIAGWSSNVQTSNDTDTRVVAARYTLSAGQSIPNNALTDIIFNARTFDSHSAMNTTTGVYTIPVSGYYSFKIGQRWASAAGGIRYVQPVITGASASFITPYNVFNTNNDFVTNTASDTLFFNAGDTIKLQGFQNSGAALVFQPSGQAYFEIERLSGPSVIAASDTVAMRYTDSSGGAIGTSLAVYRFQTRDFDSHLQYSTSTGLYTVPISGKYQIAAAMQTSAISFSAAQAVYFYIYKNGSQYGVLGQTVGNGTANTWILSGSDTVQCNAGDTLAIYVGATVATTANPVSTANHLSIVRVGN